MKVSVLHSLKERSAETAATEWARVRVSMPDTVPNVDRLFHEATMTPAETIRITLTTEKHPRDMTLVGHLRHGLLLQAPSGWKTFISYRDLYAAHAVIHSPNEVRMRISALRVLLRGIFDSLANIHRSTSRQHPHLFLV